MSAHEKALTDLGDSGGWWTADKRAPRWACREAGHEVESERVSTGTLGNSYRYTCLTCKITWTLTPR